MTTEQPASTSFALRAPGHLVHRRAIAYWTVRALIGWLALTAIQVFFLIDHPDTRTVRVILLSVTVALALAHLVVMPRWRYRVHRWEATPTAVYTQSGWFNQERRIAPMPRIQTVDTQRGPLLQLFKLSNVTVTTASAAGALKIQGLDTKTADQLTTDLTRATAATTGDAT